MLEIYMAISIPKSDSFPVIQQKSFKEYKYGFSVIFYSYNIYFLIGDYSKTNENYKTQLIK